MIRKLASFVKEYKKDAILTPIFVILEVVMEVIIPLLMARIIDVGIQNGDVNYILEMGVLLIISAILSLTFGSFSGRFAAKASAGYAKNLRKAMFPKIQDLFIWKHWQIFNIKFSYTYDNRCYKCSNGFSNDN